MSYTCRFCPSPAPDISPGYKPTTFIAAYMPVNLRHMCRANMKPRSGFATRTWLVSLQKRHVLDYCTGVSMLCVCRGQCHASVVLPVLAQHVSVVYSRFVNKCSMRIRQGLSRFFRMFVLATQHDMVLPSTHRKFHPMPRGSWSIFRGIVLVPCT